MSLKLILILSIAFFLSENNEVRVTVYHIKGLTACGEITTSIKDPFVAVSRDLLSKYPMHSTMIVKDCPFAGTYLVKDKMNKRLVKTIDVFIKSNKKKYNPCTCKIYTTEEYDNFINMQETLIKDSIKIDSIMISDTLQ
jgi:3D (Asp-Asp-Asp) domain-containing protein